MTKCECIYCKLECSKCGAEDIKITYSPVFMCRNLTEKFIVALREDDIVKLECVECGEFIEPGDELAKVLNEQLGIPTSMIFKHKNDDDIDLK